MMIKVVILGSKTSVGQALTKRIDADKELFLVAEVDTSYRGKPVEPGSRLYGESTYLWVDLLPDVVVITAEDEDVIRQYLTEAISRHGKCVVATDAITRYGELELANFAIGNDAGVCGVADMEKIESIIYCIHGVYEDPTPGLDFEL